MYLCPARFHPPTAAGLQWDDDKTTSAACYGTFLLSELQLFPLKAGCTPVWSLTIDVNITWTAIQSHKREAVGKNSWPLYRTLYKHPLWKKKATHPSRQAGFHFVQSCSFFTYMKHLYAAETRGCWDNLAKINSSKGFINVKHLTNSVQSVITTKEFTLTGSAAVPHSMKDSYIAFVRHHCLHYSISWWHYCITSVVLLCHEDRWQWQELPSQFHHDYSLLEHSTDAFRLYVKEAILGFT